MTSPDRPSFLEPLRDWVGRTERLAETLGAAPLVGLSAALDRPEDAEPQSGDPLPPLGHWLYFLPRALQREIGVDGHPRRGGFLPPVPLPRRMWAGGRLSFDRDLRVGEEVRRCSTIRSVDSKVGRSGTLVFVTVRHEISDARGVALTEEQDLVYRDHPTADTPAAVPVSAPTDQNFSREIIPDPVLLFRYSALTFNGHRIHYDRPYATQVEGYPGLIVHGPLTATLLADLLRRQMPERRLRAFSFKGLHPLFDIQSFTICGKHSAGGQVNLWARDHLGQLAMQARAELD